MPSRPKRYRVEDSSIGRHLGQRLTAAVVLAAPEASRLPRSPTEPGLAPVQLPEDWAGLQKLAAELHAMRDAIATTKREVTDLQRSPSGADGIHRATGELDAVSAATERATTAILSAVEEIEMSANILRSPSHDAARADAVGVILDRVIALYEACNFQDIAGQRIRKVVTTLKFVEERLDAVILAWEGRPPSRAAQPHWLPGMSNALKLLAGPSLPGDEGHVSQADVDAFFAGGCAP